MATTAVPSISAELRSLLRRLKLGRSLDTLPERLALARQNTLSHAEFLELVLADEVDRRDRTSAGLRARAAHLDPAMVLDAWDDTAEVTFDRALWGELTTLRFVEAANNVLALGPVGVGKTFMATALGHIAVRRRASVHFERADQLLKRLKASRLDASHDTEMRKLIRVDLLIIDDFALTAMDSAETADVYELVVERHRRAATVITSNRDPIEWLAVMADQLLAQSAIDRLTSAAYELVIEGESYRRRQKPRSPSSDTPAGEPRHSPEPTRRPRRPGSSGS
jgi:DNA replication protein DnaC